MKKLLAIILLAIAVVVLSTTIYIDKQQDKELEEPTTLELESVDKFSMIVNKLDMDSNEIVGDDDNVTMLGEVKIIHSNFEDETFSGIYTKDNLGILVDIYYDTTLIHKYVTVNYVDIAYTDYDTHYRYTLELSSEDGFTTIYKEADITEMLVNLDVDSIYEIIREKQLMPILGE